MKRRFHAVLGLLSMLGHLACLTRADGRVFLLDLESLSEGGQEEGFEGATRACMAQGARVASGADLHHAVLECAFSACTRGWLSGPSVGTTVCSDIPGSLRPVDVQLENLTASTESLGVFCVKDSDAPCGQPLSFPHSHLQGKTGLDLGDELLYACDPGYKLPNGETAFSLLCDSCGEWYGLVQHCVKDDPEGHIDYEDKFTDDHVSNHQREEHHISMLPRGAQPTEFEVDKSTPEHEHKPTVLSEEEESIDITAEDPVISVTEPPVSQLSQKHMFWFPSEAFQDENAESSSVKRPSEDENNMKVKTAISDSDPDDVADSLEHPTVPPTKEHSSPSDSNTDESWLDGYPITHDEEKTGGESTDETETENITKHSEVEVFEEETKHPVEEESKGLTDSTEKEEDGGAKYPDTKIHRKEDGEEIVKGTTGLETEEEIVTHYEETTEGLEEDQVETESYIPDEIVSDKSKPFGFGSVTDSPNRVEMKPTTFITQTTSSADDFALHKRPMVYTSASAPENVSTSQWDLAPENTSTPSGMVPLDGMPDEITSMPTPVIKHPWETIDNGDLLEPIPGPVQTEIPEDRSVVEQGGDRSLGQQERAGEGACAEDPCHSSGRGLIIAAIIIGVVAAVVGVVLGVWCYKKRQQKSSHYQLNGTNRQTQCIELQQTV